MVRDLSKFKGKICVIGYHEAYYLTQDYVFGTKPVENIVVGKIRRVIKKSFIDVTFLLKGVEQKPEKGLIIPIKTIEFCEVLKKQL